MLNILKQIGRTLLILLFCSPAFAVTYYVRPISGTYGDADGLTYAAAYDGFADLETTAAYGADDIVYVCGAHSETWSIGQSGGAGTPISFRFDCPSDPGSIDVADGELRAILIDTQTYLDFYEINLSGGTAHAINIHSGGDHDDPNYVNIYGGTVDGIGAGCGATGCGGHGIRIDGSNVLIDGVEIKNITGDGILGQGDNIEIRNCNIHDVDLAVVADGDCIQLMTDDANTSDSWHIHNNILNHSSEASKNALMVGSGTGHIIEDNIITGGQVGANLGGPYAGVTGVVFRRNRVTSMAATQSVIAVAGGGSHEIYNNIVDSVSNAVLYLLRVTDGSTASKVNNNTLYGDVSTGSNYSVIRMEVDTSLAELYNNIIYRSADGLYAINANANAVLTASNNNIFRSDAYFNYNGSIYDALATYSDGESLDGSSKAADPLLANAAGGNFNIKTGSPAINAGLDLGDAYTYDFNGYRNQDFYGSGWEIGALIYPSRKIHRRISGQGVY